MKTIYCRLLLICALLTPATFVHAALPGAEVLADLILEFDKNADSRVSREEFVDGTAEGFDDMDLNHDGQITEAEIDALSEPITESHGKIAGATVPLLVKTLLMTLDQNGDKIISRAEFTAGVSAIFVLLDTNKDGQLTKAELLELPSRLLSPSTKK